MAHFLPHQPGHPAGHQGLVSGHSGKGWNTKTRGHLWLPAASPRSAAAPPPVRAPSRACTGGRFSLALCPTARDSATWHYPGRPQNHGAGRPVAGPPHLPLPTAEPRAPRMSARPLKFPTTSQMDHSKSKRTETAQEGQPTSHPQPAPNLRAHSQELPPLTPLLGLPAVQQGTNPLTGWFCFRTTAEATQSRPPSHSRGGLSQMVDSDTKGHPLCPHSLLPQS